MTGSPLIPITQTKPAIQRRMLQWSRVRIRGVASLLPAQVDFLLPAICAGSLSHAAQGRDGFAQSRARFVLVDRDLHHAGSFVAPAQADRWLVARPASTVIGNRAEVLPCGR